MRFATASPLRYRWPKFGSFLPVLVQFVWYFILSKSGGQDWLFIIGGRAVSVGLVLAVGGVLFCLGLGLWRFRRETFVRHLVFGFGAGLLILLANVGAGIVGTWLAFEYLEHFD